MLAHGLPAGALVPRPRITRIPTPTSANTRDSTSSGWPAGPPHNDSGRRRACLPCSS